MFGYFELERCVVSEKAQFYEVFLPLRHEEAFLPSVFASSKKKLVEKIYTPRRRCIWNITTSKLSNLIGQFELAIVAKVLIIGFLPWSRFELAS